MVLSVTNMDLQKFRTLLDLLVYFKDEQVCRDYLELVRWNGNLECPYQDCGHNKIFKYSNGKVYKCDKCKRQYSVRVGTIFEDSKIPLQKFHAKKYSRKMNGRLNKYIVYYGNSQWFNPTR